MNQENLLRAMAKAQYISAVRSGVDFGREELIQILSPAKVTGTELDEMVAAKVINPTVVGNKHAKRYNADLIRRVFLAKQVKEAYPEGRLEFSWPSLAGRMNTLVIKNSETHFFGDDVGQAVITLLFAEMKNR